MSTEKLWFLREDDNIRSGLLRLKSFFLVMSIWGQKRHTAIILIKLETAGPDNHVARRLEKTAMKSDRCSIVRKHEPRVFVT